MFHIYEGNIKQVKEEMKQEKKAATIIKRAVIKSKKRIEYFSQHDQRTIAEADLTLSFFEVSRFIPIRLDEEEMVVNYLMLEELRKRIKGYQVRINIEHDAIGKKLIILYSKGKNRGRMELYELPPKVFGSLKKIPRAKLDYQTTILEKLRA